jgi:hypothetical protein
VTPETGQTRRLGTCRLFFTTPPHDQQIMCSRPRELLLLITTVKYNWLAAENTDICYVDGNTHAVEALVYLLMCS